MEEDIREEKLDSPLVVHKPTDASYQETAAEVSMNKTHLDEENSDMPTLERHRFRREKKSKKKYLWIVPAVIAVAVAIVCALVYTGVIAMPEKEAPTTRKSYTTQAVNKFENIITVKGTYIFFEGKEVNGIEGLEKKIKYLESGTKFIVQDENANSNFLNFEVLSMLSKYKIDYEITHVVSSGLMSAYETTAALSTTNAKAKEKTSKAKPSAPAAAADSE